MTPHRSRIMNYFTDSQPRSWSKYAGPGQDMCGLYLIVVYASSGLTDSPKVLCLMCKMVQFVTKGVKGDSEVMCRGREKDRQNSSHFT